MPARVVDISFTRMDNNASGSVLAVTRFDVATGDEVRIRSIATSCVLVVAVVAQSE